MARYSWVTEKKRRKSSKTFIIQSKSDSISNPHLNSHSSKSQSGGNSCLNNMIWNRGTLIQYYTLLNEALYDFLGQEAAKILKVKVGGQKNADSKLMRPRPAELANFFQPPILTSSLLTYMSIQYLIWKIWFISVWS